MKFKVLKIKGVEVEVVRKDVKNINLSVYAPDGRVRVSAPARLSAAAISSAVESRIGWIRKKQAQLRSRQVPTINKIKSGDQVYSFGKRYELKIVESRSPSSVVLSGEQVMTVSGRGLQVTEKCEALLREWHREQIRGVMPSLLATWLPVIGVELREWRIKKMKTRWGSCNIRSRRIWLNLELAKLPISCLEYVVVHELVHLLERYHNRRFHLLMDGFMPDWRNRKELLNCWQPCALL